VSIFGRIISGADVEQWSSDLVRTWLGTYLSIVEREAGLAAGFTQRPRSIVTVTSFDKWPEDQLPAVMIISTGLFDTPTKQGDGTYTANWTIDLACVVSARTEHESRAMAMRYVTALHLLFMQRASLDGNADGTTWIGETYDSLPYDDTRSLAAGIAQFAVRVENVASARGGPVTPDAPLDPDTDPWPDWPVVNTADVEVDVVDHVS
jgi:hypothetical protein